MNSDKTESRVEWSRVRNPLDFVLQPPNKKNPYSLETMVLTNVAFMVNI